MSKTQMGPEYLSGLMQVVPAYTEAEITLYNGKVVKGMARDLPRPDGSPRRWTVDGWEWFIDAELLRRVGVTNVVIALPEIEMVAL